MNKLYPLKFKPILKDKIWGGERLKNVLDKKEAGNSAGECWEISTVKDNISVVAEGFLAGNDLQELIEIYMGDLVGDKVYEKFGLEFPLLIKFIDANDDLSIQVHPEDEKARERHNSFGKTEMWYIIESDPGAELISGFNRELKKEDYISALNSGELKDILNYEKANPGDVFFMPAGRVHAIGSGILLAEIQQSSDVTYRIYDWDRRDSEGKARDLHTELALDVINFESQTDYRTDYKKILNKSVSIGECQYFSTNLIHFNKAVEKDFHLVDSFIVYLCVEGRVNIISAENQKTSIKKGESILIPAELKNIILLPDGEARVLETYVP